MKNKLQDVVILSAANGTDYKKEFKVLEPGIYVGVCYYPSAEDHNNPGMVRAIIKNKAGEPIADLVNIRDYRSRETGYLNGCKPIYFEGGQQVTVEIFASQPFAADTDFDFVFVTDAYRQ